MSCNIYEDPDLTMKVTYCKGGGAKGQDRVERVVDIYESAEAVTDYRANPSRRVRGARTRRRPQTPQRNPYKTAALLLGLLCFLLLAGISVLLWFYINQSFSSKPEQNQLTSQNQTQEKQNNTGWQEFRLSHFYYASTEKKSWIESRKDCKRRGGDLAIIDSKEKQDMINKMKIHGDSWIGLEAVKSWNVKWEWVDRSELTYSGWREGVKPKPEADLKGYTDQQGLWMYNKSGLKHWICEKTNVSYFVELPA